jgi:hypothetical protein
MLHVFCRFERILYRQLAHILIYHIPDIKNNNDWYNEPKNLYEKKGENHESEKLLQDDGNGAYRMEGHHL